MRNQIKMQLLIVLLTTMLSFRAGGQTVADFDWSAVQNFNWNSASPARHVYDKYLTRRRHVNLPGVGEIELTTEHSRYKEYYVNPSEYGILLDASSSTVNINSNGLRYHWIIEKLNKLHPFYSITGPKKTAVFEITIPKNKLSLTLPRTMLSRSEDSESDTIDMPPMDPVPPSIGIGPKLPGEGSYLITLEILDILAAPSDQVKARISKEIFVKDLVFLIFGDSNASGEGNPESQGKGGGDDGWIDIHNECGTGTITELNEQKEWYGDLSSLISEAATLGLADTKIECHNDPLWIDKHGHRSRYSGHFIAIRKLQQNHPKLFFTILSFANTGAEIEKGLVNSQNYNFTNGQIQEAKENLGQRKPDFILISVGINDIGFSNLMARVALKGSSEDYSDVETKISRLPTKFNDKLKNEIDRHFPEVGMVYFTEYPQGIFNDAAGNRKVDCGIFDGFFLGVSAIESQLLDRFNQDLNNSVKRGVALVGRDNWKIVTGIAAEFNRGHGYCAGSERWFIQHDESCYKQCDFMGTLHPNSKGHNATANFILNNLENDIKNLKFKRAKLEL